MHEGTERQRLALLWNEDMATTAQDAFRGTMQTRRSIQNNQVITCVAGGLEEGLKTCAVRKAGAPVRDFITRDFSGHDNFERIELGLQGRLLEGNILA